MGSTQSSDKLHCNRYLNGQDQLSLKRQVSRGISRKDIIPIGNQPEGQMKLEVIHRHLAGFPDDNTIKIDFTFPDGIQTERHPNPGQSFSGLQMTAYLPDNEMGRKVVKLLEKAFYQKLLFHVETTYGGDVVIPSIPLDTQEKKEKGSIGDADLEYLHHVKKMLKEKGIE